MRCTLPTQASPVRHQPFTQRTGRGLFCAPWLEQPTADGIALVQHLSQTLMQTPAHQGDLSLVLGHLLAVRGHCEEAATAPDAGEACARYTEALHDCESALATLGSAPHGTAAALAQWTRGVHILIRAQMTMPTDAIAARTLAYEALHQLSGIADPLCAGAESDSLAAMLLVREPVELDVWLASLPDEVGEAARRVDADRDRFTGDVNHALMGLRQAQEQRLAWGLGWLAINLLLFATFPLNCIYASNVPWSLPFLLALPAIWWFTWARPFCDGLSFFAWLQWRWKLALDSFLTISAQLPALAEQLNQALEPLLEQGFRHRLRLQAFRLHQAPEPDGVAVAETIAAGARQRCQGVWMAEFWDCPPAQVAEVIASDPAHLARATRIWYGEA